MQEVMLKLLKTETDLPSPPSIAIRILEEIKKEDCSLERLSRIIGTDPALVAKVLRASNSSHFGLIAEVETLPRAISLLGLNAVKNIVLSFVLTDNIRAGNDEGSFDYDLFWRRSVTAAVSAELVCKLIDKPCGDIFITSLLQDIGMVIMYHCYKEDYIQIIEEAYFNLSNREAIEKEVYSFTHEDMGAKVLENWGLPQNIYAPIGYHHSPQDAPDELRSTSEILHISDKLSLIYHGKNSAETIEKIKDTFNKQYRITSEQVDNLIDTIADHTVELLSFFDLPPGDMKPFSQILQDANAELGKLNITYEQLVLQYKTAKEAAEKLARELQKANQKLRKLATSDGLTGQYNHRAFQDILNKRVSEANRHKRWLSLIIFDLDHFKNVNDKYGHPVGDATLKVVSATIAKLLRKEDVFARYGGEEFAVILPETDVNGALLLAERVRKAVEALVITINGISFQITISIGLSSKNPHQNGCKKSALVDAADKALYLAKHSGRNLVRGSVINVAAAKDVVQAQTDR